MHITDTDQLKQLIAEIVKTTLEQIDTENEKPPLLVDIREAARLLDCSDKTIFNLTKSGSLPVVKIGKSVRYDPTDLAAWINRSKTTSNPATAS